MHSVADAAVMGGTDMDSKCVNYWCSPSYHEGKLIRVEFELGGPVGERQLKTMPLWLCARCARDMTPASEVAANTTAKMRLSHEDRMQVLGGRSAITA